MQPILRDFKPRYASRLPLPEQAQRLVNPSKNAAYEVQRRRMLQILFFLGESIHPYRMSSSRQALFHGIHADAKRL